MTESTSPKKSTPAKAKAENSVSVPSVSYSEHQSRVASAVVGPGDTDTVKLSALVYKNIHQRKSLSVHHLQRRLNELGYAEAYADRDGFYGDLTAQAVGKFQQDNDLDVTTFADAPTIEKIFKDDPNVTLDTSDYSV
jgi:peptidoglycan hydrolase-like protein with peptidoglycan-binding domain